MAHDVAPTNTKEDDLFLNEELVITETIELKPEEDLTKAQAKAIDTAADKVEDEINCMGPGKMVDDPSPEKIKAMLAEEAKA